MTDQELFLSAKNWLLDFDKDRITIDDLNKHLYLQPEDKNPKNMNAIFKGLCHSAQNKQMSTKVIGKSIDGFDNLGNVLFDFDPNKVADNYEKNDWMKLFDKIDKELSPKGQKRLTNRSIWPQFCQSVIDSAYFLQTFKTAEDFYKWANFFAEDVRAKPALPLMISIEITGIGFPLACDFLKEIGYEQFGKPDVHLKEIFKELNIIDPEEKSIIKQDFATMKAIDKIAKSNDVTSYEVDKVFWLIGSGDYYKTLGRKRRDSQEKREEAIGKRRNEFIKFIKQKE